MLLREFPNLTGEASKMLKTWKPSRWTQKKTKFLMLVASSEPPRRPQTPGFCAVFAAPCKAGETPELRSFHVPFGVEGGPGSGEDRLPDKAFVQVFSKSKKIYKMKVVWPSSE
jgi:hypothetical protein